ncbi:MAG: GDSL-type esterase/lipase family protein [Planctomycetes bacterium]|nr:GDSL-type esterase/lipase family protein [Planctomycetota bacterium]
MRPLLLLLMAVMTLAAADRQPVTIVCLGDSITGPRPGQAYLHQYVKWSDLLQLAIENRSGPGSVTVLNRGWAGDTSSAGPGADPPGALSRLQRDVLDVKPQICVLMIGGNNFAVLKRQPARRAEVEAGWRADLEALVGRMHQAGIRVLLLQYPEPRAADPATAWATVDDGNAITAAVAAERSLPTLALEPFFAAARAAGASDESLLNAVDGVHLNPLGEVVIARAVAVKLRALGWLPADVP